MRYNVAQQLVALADVLGPKLTRYTCLLVRWLVGARLQTATLRFGVDSPRNKGGCARSSHLTAAFVRLLRDNEAEVRVAAAGKVSAFCKSLDASQVSSQIIPCVKDLASDSSQYVRAALAGVVMELAPILDKQVRVCVARCTDCSKSACRVSL